MQAWVTVTSLLQIYKSDYTTIQCTFQLMEFGGYAIYAFFSDEDRKTLKLKSKQEKTFSAGLRGYLRLVKIKV